MAAVVIVFAPQSARTASKKAGLGPLAGLLPPPLPAATEVTAGNQPNLYLFASGRYLQIMTWSVLLDLDGTLIDSQPGILASCLAALRSLGHEPDETLDITGTIGPPLEEMMQVLLRPYGDDRVSEAVAA